MDGRLVASVLADIEAALAGPVASELESIKTSQIPPLPLKQAA
jgi:hypothetical protein